MWIARRSVLKGLAAGGTVTLIGPGAWAQAAGPAEAGQIDIAKAKAEGKVVLYTSLDTQIVDAINAEFTQEVRHRGAVLPRRLVGCDVQGAGGSRCGPAPGGHGRRLRSRRLAA